MLFFFINIKWFKAQIKMTKKKIYYIFLIHMVVITSQQCVIRFKDLIMHCDILNTVQWHCFTVHFFQFINKINTCKFSLPYFLLTQEEFCCSFLSIFFCPLKDFEENHNPSFRRNAYDLECGNICLKLTLYSWSLLGLFIKFKISK